MKDKAAFFLAAVFISSLLAVISCSQKKTEWKGTIKEENGVIVVKNPKDPMYGEDVFDSEGKYIAKIPMSARLNSASVWKNNKLYTIEEDEEGFQTIKRYNVAWNLK